MAAPKQPADHKPKLIRPEDVPGMELLRPIDEVPVWDQGPIMDLVYSIMGEASEEDIKSGKIQFQPKPSMIAEMGRAMLPFAKDEAAFTKFCTGRTAMQRVAELAMAWTSSLGEEVRSEDS